jgi:FkbM family methyltransferase
VRILIDCGAHTADSLPDLVRLFGPFDRLVAFEANPAYAAHFERARETWPVELVQAAVWVQDGTIRFYLGEEGPESSVLFEKTTGGFRQDNALDVPSVDFSAWMSREVGPADEVVLKMDIEGAEFPVLEKMLADGTTRRVELLLIEWHADRLPTGHMKLRRKWIELRLWLRGVRVLRWSKKYLRRKGYAI